MIVFAIVSIICWLRAEQIKRKLSSANFTFQEAVEEIVAVKVLPAVLWVHINTKSATISMWYMMDDNIRFLGGRGL